VAQIRPTQIKPDGELDLSEAYAISPSELQRNDYVVDGEALFNNTNSTALVGKTAVYRGTRKVVCSNHITRLRIQKNIEPDFVAEVLNALQRRGYFARLCTNFNNQAGVNADCLAEVRLPMPQKDERTKLLAELNKARSSRQQKIARAEGLLTGLDNYLLSQLGLTPPPADHRKVFAVRLKDIDGPLNAGRYLGFHLHKYVKGTVFEKVAEVLEEKVAPSKEAPDKDWDWIRIDDLPNQPLEMENIRTMPGAEIQGTFFEVQQNEILLARLGPTILNAKVVLCPKTQRRTVASGEFLVLRCREGWNPLVVLWTLRTKLFRDLMYSKGRGGTPSRYRLNREDLIALPFPEISGRTRDVLIPEIKRRLETAHRLRAEAAADWAAAKAEFERKLLGESAPR
jgi:hypothetical protein